MAGIKHKKLEEWISAGVIDSGIADKIQAYEAARKKGRFGNGLINLSLFAILVGILSVIASNWNEIPGFVKIGVHVLLNLGVGYLAILSDKKGRDMWREGATFALLGLTFTLIILIGQVYQLTGNVAGAMLLWMVAATPFLWLLARSVLVNTVWVLGILGTLGALQFEYLQGADDLVQFYVVCAFATLMPLFILWLGTSHRLDVVKPVLKPILQKIAVVWLLIGASAGASIGAANANEFTLHTFVVLLIGLCAIGLHGMKHGFYKDHEYKKLGALFVFISFILLFLPTVLPSSTPSVIHAFVFVGYWVFIGWVAQKMDIQKLLSFAVFVIAVRIFVVYIELFGTLLTTGVGLIVSGVVMLGLIYAARKMNARLTNGGKVA